MTAALASAQTKTELGEINHAKFRIDVPDNWNHGLVVYCHGYSAEPGAFTNKELPKALAVFVKAGYALVQSGYSQGGWAVEQAIPETEALRQRSEERRVGKECRSVCRSRWSPYH